MAKAAVEHLLVERILSGRAAWRTALLLIGSALLGAPLSSQTPQTQPPPTPPPPTPPRVVQAQRFLRSRAWPGSRRAMRPRLEAASLLKTQLAASSPSTAAWEPLGPAAVITPNFGPVTGRVSSIAIDPADATGNHVFIGTTGGGVWASNNAASSGNVVFTPLTDAPAALTDVRLPSISIGALTVQPGGTGVILAGTGDPNDALDSYYGSGILRSIDGGKTWSAIPNTADKVYSFEGEGFAGFAWSTVNPQLVVAAVSEAYEGTLVSAQLRGVSYSGLYYSTDAGANWTLATITDSPGSDVQGPRDSFASPNGNSATAVVWNPVHRLFIAAVRFHGYYQSADGITWTKVAAQPGTAFSNQNCPTNPSSMGSIACPIFRGALAVNPTTGDTFAWTVDLYNQDQGIWQDTCAISAGSCTNRTFAFSQRWSTASLAMPGSTTIANGDYNLTLAAVPSGQDTLLLAGANDLWKCSLAMGCMWRNTTNATTCMSAKVPPYQHALAWNQGNPQEILIGNDSGLWRSMDAIAETGSVCTPDDAGHFQNLNSGLGSLAETESLSQVVASSYTMVAGFGVNGTAGVKSTTGPTSTWPQILGGEGGPVAIDPAAPSTWYVNNGAGVSIYRCLQAAECSSEAFGTRPVVSNADVFGDSFTMSTPAPFIVDPLDHTNVLLGTCRLWRGPADGSGWTSSNAITPMLEGSSGLGYCSGNTLIRSIAALPIAGGGEVIYAGLYGSLNGGGILGGHVLRTTFIPGSSSPGIWQDLTLNDVLNDQVPFNYYGLDISSIFIDPHDPTGNTVYITVAGVPDLNRWIRTVYRTTDGGATWNQTGSNLVHVPANSIVIDPQDANTAYVATDVGVYSTRQIGSCVNTSANCWSVFGTGLPFAPVVQLSAAPPGSTPDVLVAGTYGRGIWQIPLWTAGQQITTASVQPSSLTFDAQPIGTVSPTQTIVLTNTGGIALLVSSISVSAGFNESDSCANAVLNAGSNCRIQVSFAPGSEGSTTGQLVINANVAGGQVVIALAGSGSAGGLVTASPGGLDFGMVQINTTSTSLFVTLENGEDVQVAIQSVSVPLPFKLASNPCGALLARHSACSLGVTFAPTQAGSAAATLTVTDDAGQQTVVLTGTGAAVETDDLSASSLSFSSTVVGQLSIPQTITLSNNGDLPLTAIAASASTGYQVSTSCGGSLAGHSACVINVTFAPEVAGTATGILTVVDEIRTRTISLSGVGVLPPVLGVSSTQLNFPTQPVGQASGPIVLTISNSGGAAMANVGFQITGQSASSFSVAASACGATLDSGARCGVSLTFKPVSAGQLNATLVVSSSTSGVVPVQVGLSGIGQTSSGISVSPAQLSFIQPALQQASAPQTVTVTNSTSTTAGGIVVNTAAPFSITQSTCGSALAAGTSCTVSIVFTPTANGVVSGTLSVISTTFVDPALASLVGVGGAAGSIDVHPRSLTFSMTGVGATSAAQSVTVVNNGTIPVLSLGFSPEEGFRVLSSTCPASLGPGASCVAEVQFAPGSAGQHSAQLAIASPSLAATQTVALAGMGFDFGVSSGGASSQTVASGQTARFTLNLSPMSGSSGAFAFSCSSLPAHSSCSFNPASEAVAANATGTVQVQVATGVSTASAQNSGPAPWGLKGLIELACLFVAVPVATRSRKKNLLRILILAVGLLTLTSCAGAGGGTGGTPPPTLSNNTPPGTYTIVVTATSNAVAHSTSLTLVVD